MIKVQQQAEAVASNATNQSTVCVLCSQNCGLKVDVEKNKITKVVADKDNPITSGYSCNKAYSIKHYVEHKQRVEHPLKRMPNGDYERVSWDQAISEIAVKLNRIRKQKGGDHIALNGVGGQANHMDAFFALGFLTALGSPWWFNSYAQEKTQHHWVDNRMAKAPVTDAFHPDAWNSRYILMMGTNPLLSNRGTRATDSIKAYLKDDQNRLAVVDPRVSESARRAHAHLALKPGTDAYLLMAMIKIILSEGNYDSSFLNKHAKNFEKLKSLFNNVDATVMADRCGLDFDTVKAEAIAFANAKGASIFYDLGVEQIMHSTLVAWLIRILSAITGNYAQYGGNHFMPSFAPDMAMAVKDQQFKANVSGVEAIPALGPFGMFSPYLIPEEVEAGNISALIVEGSNPLLSYADTQRFTKALNKLELLVVIEPAMTETAREADYVLPTPTGYEKWEWSSFPKAFPEMYAQLRPPVLSGPTEALPEAEIYSRLVTAMGVIPKAPFYLKPLAKLENKSFLFNALLGSAVVGSRLDQDRLLGFSLFWAYQTLGPELVSPTLVSVWFSCYTYAFSRRSDALRTLGADFKWATPFAIGEEIFKRIMDHPEGVEVGKLDEHHNFEYGVRTKDKTINLLPKDVSELFDYALNFQNERASEYPYTLIAGERTQWNANTIHRSNDWRKGRGPHFWIKMHTQLAEEVGVEENDTVVLTTAVGQLQAPAKISDAMPYGVVSVPNGFGMEYPNAEGELQSIGQNVNSVTCLDYRDPITAIPYLKHQACALGKL